MSPFARIFIYSVIVADCFAIIYFGGNAILTGSVIPEHGGGEAKIVVAGAEAPASAETAAPKADEKPFDLAAYVADPVKGEKIAAKCKACHTFENGGANRTGPNMWGIVGNHVAHKDDFSYSSALLAKKAEIGTWDDPHLFAFLESPKDYIPGTKMQFNGVKNPAERADLISWLKTLK
jgi:cytochrome c